MKKAEIYSIPVKHQPGYAWKWRTLTGKTESRASFGFYFDCLGDARDHGYDIELTQAIGTNAPGGARHKLA
jgi:hypothetical protein